MKTFLFATSALALISTPAFAHIGHLGGAAGHDHWLAGAAIGIAAGITLWGFAKGRKPNPEQQAEAEGDAEPEEDEAPKEELA